MKSIHISRMEHLRSINIRIGFATAILIAIFAFNWTTERTAQPPYSEETFMNEVALQPFIIKEPNQQSMPNAKVLRPNNLILEVPELVLGFQPTTIPIDSSASNISDPGNVVMQTEPAINLAQKPIHEEVGPKEIFKIVEDMPIFKGCDKTELSKQEKQECTSNRLLSYLYSKITYPEIARDQGIEGTVYIKFVVETDGSVSNATILRDIGGGCGEEALRAVNSLPSWIPGKQRGNPVRVQFSLPIKFRLN